VNEHLLPVLIASVDMHKELSAEMIPNYLHLFQAMCEENSVFAAAHGA
jgi:hypothetical protein